MRLHTALKLLPSEHFWHLPLPVWEGGVFAYRENVNLLAQDNTQQRFVDVDLTVVLDEPQIPELIHEIIDSGPRCANHFSQHLLRYFGNHLLRLVLRAIARQ